MILSPGLKMSFKNILKNQILEFLEGATSESPMIAMSPYRPSHSWEIYVKLTVVSQSFTVWEGMQL